VLLGGPPGERLEELPGDARVRLDDRPELPRGEPERHDVRLRGHGRRARRLGDESDLAEVVAGAQPADLLAVDLDARLAVLDDEEADARLALLGDDVSGAEAPFLHGGRDVAQIAGLEAREERHALEELDPVLVHGGSLIHALQRQAIVHERPPRTARRT
jgi:hypothetical protein